MSTVKVNEIKHIIDKQYENEQAFLQAFQAGTYTLEQPLVQVNPYLITPLTALVMFRTEEEVEVTVVVKGKEEAGNFVQTLAKAKEHFVPVLGLYPDCENTVEITLSNGQSQAISIQTAALNEHVKLPTKMDTTHDYMQDNMMFVIPAMGSIPSAYDYKGDCRWYCEENLAFDLKRISNGRVLIGSYRFMEKPYHTVGIFEMSLLGKIYAEYTLPGGYHHDQWEMEDGNLLILTQDFKSGTVEDMCVLVERETGNILKTWDFKKILPQNVAKSGSWSDHDWFHNNALWYDKNTHSITLSGRHQDAIINIDYETGDLKWIIGTPEGWPQEMVDKYFFKPVGEGEFEWQYEQHACLVTPQGDVMTFDNGHFRAKNKENYVLGKNNYSRGVRYRINTEDMTIEQVWQYGKERGAEFFSPYICNVEYYGEGHYMVHSGGIAELDGVTVEGVGSRRYFEDKNVKLYSKTVELVNDEVVYEMHLEANYYRAEKLPLYDAKDVLTFGKGKVLGTLGETEEFETGIDGTEDKGLVPEKFDISFDEEVDRLIFNGSFEKGQLVMLIAEDQEGTEHRFFIPTTALSFAAMCVGTFQTSDARRVKFNINKAGLKGELKMRLIVDMDAYDLGVTFNL
ncbi:MAG: aryl-sulfate sulfotransferase [Cellulosilyticaceae bacterium]